MKVKVRSIFHACVGLCCLATFLAIQNYERMVDSTGASRKMSAMYMPRKSNVSSGKDKILSSKPKQPQKQKQPILPLAKNATIQLLRKRKSHSEIFEGVPISQDGDVKLKNTSSNTATTTHIDPFPSTKNALECLRKTKPDLPDLVYPKDALEHFREIHDRLGRWVQQENHKPHKAAGYKGPWIENRWISRFQNELLLESNKEEEDESYNLSKVFGPYIPIFIPWTDIWVKNRRYAYPKELASVLKNVLREDVLYITVNQNADGLVGRCSEFRDLQNKFPITVLSAGGYGHVPIPLLKQPEKNIQKIPLDQRKHLISYVGKSKNAPKEMREKMIEGLMQLNNNTNNDQQHFYYYGKSWRNVMAESKFSLCPRGYGRTSYHVMEALQMGLIPIQVYQDQSWLPYGNLLQNISFAVTNEELPALIAELSQMPNSEIASMEERIEDLKQDYFTFEGTLNQISKFMKDPSSSELVCQPLPLDSGSKHKKTRSCRRPRRRKRKRQPPKKAEQEVN